MICTPFSIAGACYMIYSYFKSEAKSFSSKLVFCLALSDMLLSIVDLLEIFDPYDENCTVIGFLRNGYLFKYALDNVDTCCTVCSVCVGICWS